MSLPTCGTACTDNLPALDFSKCAPVLNAAQISKIFFTNPGNPMSDWSNALEWDSRLDQDASGSSKIRTLIGIGEFTEPAQEEKEISLGRKFRGVKNFTINHVIDETGDANYEAMRQLECNSGAKLIWFQTRDGLLYGGNAGIEASIKMNQVITNNYQDFITFNVKIEWQYKFHPERITSPITDSIGDQF